MHTTLATDVFVLGGGPAGAAVALMLQQQLPGTAVLIAEASVYEQERPGEALAPQGLRLLQQLGAGEAFLQLGALKAPGLRSAWGHAEPVEQDHFTKLAGEGWNLDRRKFDAMLTALAVQRGATLLTGFTFKGAVERVDAHWRLTLEGAEGETKSITAKFIVDASGRNAVLARKIGAQTGRVDRLCGYQRYYQPGEVRDLKVQIEAAPLGWWYTAPLPGGRLAATFFTDADIAATHGLREVQNWEAGLRHAPLTAKRLAGAEAEGSDITVFQAVSHSLTHTAGEGWLAAGDAACAFDPLSGAGMIKAMRSGMLAAYCIADQLRGISGAAEKYNHILQSDFNSYCNQRCEQYATEKRWPDSLFWKRRSDTLHLRPQQMLRRNGDAFPANGDCPWMQAAQLTAFLSTLKKESCEAAELARRWKAMPGTTASDLRILLALQWLHEHHFLQDATMETAHTNEKNAVHEN